MKMLFIESLYKNFVSDKDADQIQADEGKSFDFDAFLSRREGMQLKRHGLNYRILL